MCPGTGDGRRAHGGRRPVFAVVKIDVKNFSGTSENKFPSFGKEHIVGNFAAGFELSEIIEFDRGDQGDTFVGDMHIFGSGNRGKVPLA